FDFSSMTLYPSFGQMNFIFFVIHYRVISMLKSTYAQFEVQIEQIFLLLFIIIYIFLILFFHLTYFLFHLLVYMKRRYFIILRYYIVFYNLVFLFNILQRIMRFKSQLKCTFH
ncbi:hypothetical protein IMG5_036710, partial [Ichthyophthirius multifiliis]